MFEMILKKIAGTKNDRDLKKMYPLVEEINGLESSLSALTDSALKEKTVAFKKRLERIQVCRQGGYEGFTFTGFHLGNSSCVENDAPEQLYIEMPHVDDAF